jgi:2'-5' RNA ligase
MARLFIAVLPPPEILDALAELPRPDEEGVRWTRRESWHMTLRFFADAEVDEIVRAIDDCPLSAADARIGPKVGRLGRRVIMAPVEGLDELAADVMHATALIGETADTRPFNGHITLARMKRPGRCSLVGRPVSGAFPVDTVVLMESDTRPDGARYTERARFGLGG